MTAELRLTLQSRLSSLQDLGDSLDRFGDEQDWPVNLRFHLRLALEELATNVIKHGFGEEGHEFEIEISSSPEKVVVNVTDGARPFNPLEAPPDPNVEAPLEDRPIGGLGVFLVRKISDEMFYRRTQGKNRLTIVKLRN